MCQNVEGLERASTYVLLELDVVVNNLKEGVCLTGDQADQTCQIDYTESYIL